MNGVSLKGSAFHFFYSAKILPEITFVKKKTYKTLPVWFDDDENLFSQILWHRYLRFLLLDDPRKKDYSTHKILKLWKRSTLLSYNPENWKKKHLHYIEWNGKSSKESPFFYSTQKTLAKITVLKKHLSPPFPIEAYFTIRSNNEKSIYFLRFCGIGVDEEYDLKQHEVSLRFVTDGISTGSLNSGALTGFQTQYTTGE